jgi:DNA mismatch endonuclease, patch repair protein
MTGQGSWASSKAVRASMQSNKGRDTGPEMRLRSAVHALGLRYRVSARPLPGLRRTADLVFRGPKVAVFLDGCFWHGCPVHHTRAATNADYWEAKVVRNRARDRETDASLRAEGWLPLRFWEHEDPAEVALKIQTAVRTRKA